MLKECKSKQALAEDDNTIGRDWSYPADSHLPRVGADRSPNNKTRRGEKQQEDLGAGKSWSKSSSSSSASGDGNASGSARAPSFTSATIDGDDPSLAAFRTPATALAADLLQPALHRDSVRLAILLPSAEDLRAEGKMSARKAKELREHLAVWAGELGRFAGIPVTTTTVGWDVVAKFVMHKYVSRSLIKEKKERMKKREEGAEKKKKDNEAGKDKQQKAELKAVEDDGDKNEEDEDEDDDELEAEEENIEIDSATTTIVDSPALSASSSSLGVLGQLHGLLPRAVPVEDQEQE